MKELKKTFITIIALIVIIIGTGIFSLYFIEEEVNVFQDHIDSIKEKIKQDNWQSAYEESEEMFKKWEKRKITWSIVLDHRKMDDLEALIVRCFQYVRFKNTEEAIVELNQAAQQLMLLEKSEIPTLANIL